MTQGLTVEVIGILKKSFTHIMRSDVNDAEFLRICVTDAVDV